MTSTKEILIRAKEATRKMAKYSDSDINRALHLISECLVNNTDKILSANEKDLALAEGSISEVMKDRLRLTPERIIGMAKGISEICALPSSVGNIISENVRPNGLKIKKVSVPLGVIAIIYESRPNVTSDAAALALKSKNVSVLRGGKEAYNSSRAIVDAICEGLVLAGLDSDLVQLVSDTSRDSARELMQARGYIDLLIPRGGKGLISSCVENATVPCLETGTGICHIYIDRSADIEMALNILENAKTSRPSVCNAAEVCLVHSDIAEVILPKIKKRLCDSRPENPVTLKCDGRAMKIIDGVPMGKDDFDTEFLDYVLAVGIVDSVEEAVKHIAIHSTRHSEAIIAEDGDAIEAFTEGVDSAAVYINASTRFTDGGEFGLGCEMGISTQKLHARGPVGICELTTYKYVIEGSGQIR